jgi:membrane protein
VIRSGAALAWRAFLRFQHHDGPDRAAAVAYYALLSLLPLLIFLISIGVALLGSFEEAYKGTLFLFRGVVIHMDERSLDMLRDFVQRATRFQWPGILILAWTGRRIFAALFGALERVFEVRGRGFAKGNLLAVGMVMVTGAGLLITLALATAVAATEGFIQRIAGSKGVERFHDLTGLAITHLLPVAVTFSFFFVIYRVAPRRVVGTGHAAVGAVLATFMWEGAKAGFAYYVRNLAHYAGLYGALEAVIVLALWLELSVSIILYCGEVVALLVPPRLESGTKIPISASG